MSIAMVVSSGEKSTDFFHKIFAELAYDKIVTVRTASEARKEFVQSEFDLCIINSPLADEKGINLCIEFSKNYATPIILIVKNEIFEKVCKEVDEYGIITISKPLNPQILMNALRVAQASRKHIEKMNNENKMLLKKIDDLKTIDRAKCLLISYLGMSEPEAHKYIERQAMDMRITKKEVSEGIIKTYEY